MAAGHSALRIEIHGAHRVRWAGNVTDIEARAIVTVPSSAGFRMITISRDHGGDRGWCRLITIARIS